MSDFSKAVEYALVEYISKGDWIKRGYDSAITIPPTLLREIYSQVDMDLVKTRVLEKVQDKIADTMFAALSTEIATDIKKIMCNQELREDIRALIRSKIRCA